jgi:integrase
MRENKNHPVKGSRITVDPIQSLDSIKTIKEMLSNKPRDLLLFTMGINNGLRVGDLLKLKVKDVKTRKPDKYFTITEGKTNKKNIVMINKTVFKVLVDYLDKANLDDDDYLFQSKKTKKPLSIQAVNSYIKKWCRSINLPGNYGAHSLRKTFGYIQRINFKVGFEVLAKRFNHSSPAVTMRYLGIQDKEVSAILVNEI